MATSQAFTSPFLSAGASIINSPIRHSFSFLPNPKRLNFRIQAAKLPPGVELPKEQPKFQAPFLGFTKTAEIWNSRACMIGLIGTFIVELILNKGILQIIGVDVVANQRVKNKKRLWMLTFLGVEAQYDLECWTRTSFA